MSAVFSCRGLGSRDLVMMLALALVLKDEACTRTPLQAAGFCSLAQLLSGCAPGNSLWLPEVLSELQQPLHAALLSQEGVDCAAALCLRHPDTAALLPVFMFGVAEDLEAQHAQEVAHKLKLPLGAVMLWLTRQPPGCSTAARQEQMAAAAKFLQSAAQFSSCSCSCCSAAAMPSVSRLSELLGACAAALRALASAEVSDLDGKRRFCCQPDVVTLPHRSCWPFFLDNGQQDPLSSAAQRSRCTTHGAVIVSADYLGHASVLCHQRQPDLDIIRAGSGGKTARSPPALAKQVFAVFKASTAMPVPPQATQVATRYASIISAVARVLPDATQSAAAAESGLLRLVPRLHEPRGGHRGHRSIRHGRRCCGCAGCTDAAACVLHGGWRTAAEVVLRSGSAQGPCGSAPPVCHLEGAARV